MRLACLAVLALVGSASAPALAARPATPSERAGIQRGAQYWLFSVGVKGPHPFEHASVPVACLSTAVPGYAAAIVANRMTEPPRSIVLFVRLATKRPVWHPYQYASPQNLWFAPRGPGVPSVRLRAEHDLKAHCRLTSG